METCCGPLCACLGCAISHYLRVTDLEVLKTIDLKTIKFRVICAEDFDFNPVSKTSEINQYLNENGYEIVDRAGPSSIYVKSSWLQENLTN